MYPSDCSYLIIQHKPKSTFLNCHSSISLVTSAQKSLGKFLYYKAENTLQHTILEFQGSNIKILAYRSLT